MQFKGQLLLPDEPGPGLRVNLDVAEHHLAVESDGGGLGAWPLEAVDVERLQGDIFTLTVAGEPLRFVADDTIAFAYSGVPTIERVSRPRARSAFRSMLDRIWNGPGEAAPPVAALAVPGESQRDEPVEESPPPPSVSPSAIGQVIVAPLIEDDEPSDAVEDTMPPIDLEMPKVPAAADALNDTEGCPAVRGDGRRCQSPILTSSGYCYPHDPKRVFEDRYKEAQEARARLKRDATARLNRIYGRLDKAMRQVERGELDPGTAMAMAQLARTMCAIVDMEEPSAGDH
jgi:hypothetical protein